LELVGDDLDAHSMITNQNKHLIGKARLLRRQGKTYDEIRDVLGVPSSEDALHARSGC
jgi:hypothetical protein